VVVVVVVGRWWSMFSCAGNKLFSAVVVQSCDMYLAHLCFAEMVFG
jgi:hypothetical protein